jgi:DNA-binding NarL/FixJ family response regulator
MFRADRARSARNKTFEEYPMSASLMIVDDSATMRKIVMRTVRMGSLELVKKIRELGNCAKTQIIIVSTESSEELVNQAMTNGANGHITKPFTPEKFQEKFSQCMN